MKTNPILEEIWRTKDRLATDAGYDVDVFLEQLREWSAAHPPSGPVIHSAEDLRRLATTEEALRYPTATTVPSRVRETPTPKQSEPRRKRRSR